MGLSNDLLSQFAKVTNDTSKKKKETSTVYGTVVEGGGVKLDGSDIVTPVSTTVDMKAGDRVIVMIKNHSATVTGNLNDPAASSKGVSESSKQITSLGIAVADRVTTEQLNSEKANITKELIAADATIKGELTASIAKVEQTLTAKDVEIADKVTAAEGEIAKLKTNTLDAESAALTYATIKNLEATNEKVNSLDATHANFESATATKFEAVNTNITNLSTNKLDAESAKVTYANIDFSNIGKAAIEKFFSTSGMISNLAVGDGTVTGKLVGVTISGDLIEGNTVKAEKLVVKGSDGLYYKLNIEAGVTTSEKVTVTDLQNGLHGTAIIAKTITAEKISVNDLVAFGATIGGFHITNSSLYSGSKESVSHTTQGIYLDSTGQMAVGDASNFMKYYKDANGNYVLEISANSILLGSSKKNIETTIDEVKTSVDGLEIGGRNLVPINRISTTRNVITTKEFELRNDWASVFIDAENLAAMLDPGTEYYIRYNLELIERTDVPTPFDMRAGFLIYREGVWVDIGTYAFTEDAQIGDVATVSKKFTTPDEWNGEQLIVYSRRWTTEGSSPVGFDAFKVTNFKIEKGNKPTAWTPAPEDLAMADAVSNAQLSAEQAYERAEEIQSTIEQLADSISMLVTDGNGTSLMTQTENGWTFSTGDIQRLVNEVSDGLGSLIEEVGGVNGAVDVLQQAVSDLGKKVEYVNVTTYEDEPCVELGETDSDFKLRITNTRMMFTEGSTILGYFTNQSFNSKKVVIEEELQQAGFVWKRRSNKNLALMWKGDDE